MCTDVILPEMTVARIRSPGSASHKEREQITGGRGGLARSQARLVGEIALGLVFLAAALISQFISIMNTHIGR